jgi:hypothetical protein
MSNNDKSAALTKISTINAVEGFDPTPLAVDYTDMNTGETRKRLPVMSQVAWFRLKYPEGRFMINVTAGKDCFIASARVYKNCMDPTDCFLSEASASRGYNPDKPTVSPREWAQTAALGIALRNAGFGLQFHAAGESFDEPAVNEMGQLIDPLPTPDIAIEYDKQATQSESGIIDESTRTDTASMAVPEKDPLEIARALPCPTMKHKDKTLGEMVSIDRNYLVWIATKFQGNPEASAAAKLICDHALAATA